MRVAIGVNDRVADAYQEAEDALKFLASINCHASYLFVMPLLRKIAHCFQWMVDGVRWRSRLSDLGETLSETISRFGDVRNISEKRSKWPQYEFEHLTTEISAVYKNNRLVMVWISSDSELHDNFISECFSNYSRDLNWRKVADVNADVVEGLFAYDRERCQYWEREDGKAWACFARTGRGGEDARFHLDFTSGMWQRIKRTRYPTSWL